MNRLKKGDSVIVIAGKDKGKKGEILRIIEPDRLIVSNVNMLCMLRRDLRDVSMRVSDTPACVLLSGAA